MSGDGLPMPSQGGAAHALPVPAGPARAGYGRVRRPALTLRPAWLQAVPPLVTFAVVLWGITGSSYWRDEAASLSAAERPLGNLVRMLGHVDAVHGAYYVIIWAVVRIGGAGELATRLPSALAMAAAAAAVTALGRRLVSPRAGLASGLVFAILPEVSWYGQEARSYAMVTALAAVASYLLVRALQAAGGAGAGRWLAAYGAVLAALGKSTKLTHRFLQHLGRLHISTITLAELYTWALRKNAPPKRLQSLKDLLDDVIVLDITPDVSRKFGELQAVLLDAGRPAPEMDLLIAVTALVHDLTLVTHNTQDFASIPGLRLDDWLTR